MFPAKSFDAFVDLVTKAAQRHTVDGHPEEIYEPLDHIEPGLPRTLIHVSGSEVLLHDARLAAQRLAAAEYRSSCGCGPARCTCSRSPGRWCRRPTGRCARLATTSARRPTEKPRHPSQGSCRPR